MNLSTDLLTADPVSPRWPFAVASGIFGWILDAFDFFAIVFLFDTLAARFHVDKAAIVYTLTLTLAMRPIGAFAFGAFADRFGRKRPLILCVLFFSTITTLSGFSPSYLFFLTMRALYGIGMGGYWGIGASYVMESAPRRLRGVLSGMMQGGYPLGYLLAAAATQFVVPVVGWRSMFLIGWCATALIMFFTALAAESQSWVLHCRPSLGLIFRTLFAHRAIFVYLLLVMTMMSCLSHGTQDLYPDFLKSVPSLAGERLLAMSAVFGIPVLYNLAAIAGAPLFGHLSENVGRRHAMMFALGVSLLSMPAWAFGTSLFTLAIGSCVMQAGVQGAFGVIPAHLNELSPDAIRSLFPGFLYQLGVLIASPAVSVEYFMQKRLGYPWTLTLFEATVMIALFIIFALGPERKGRSFYGVR
jgi:MFS transporter, SHS family, lactate transporter